MWGSTYQSHFGKLIIKQKKIVRMIQGGPPHTKPLFLELYILKVSSLYKYSIAFYVQIE